MAADAPAQRQSPRFLWLYALAAAGGAIAYVPFLTILLPRQLTSLAGEADLAWLAYCGFAGAVTASIANIAFGWLSDRSGSRRPWIAGGLVLSCLSLIAFARVETLAAVIALIVVWQAALNMMLGPLSAWAGDVVPDAQKGWLGGLLAFAPAGGALAGTLVTYPGLVAGEQRLWLVAVLVCACVLPALLLGRPRAFPSLQPDPARRAVPTPLPATPPPAQARPAVVRMWLARLMMQVTEAALFAFIYFWLRSIDPAFGETEIARIFGVVLIAAVPAALLAGRWADRRNAPFRPLRFAALGAAAGLALMAFAQNAPLAVGAYMLFGLSAGVFLALHTGQTLRVLPRPEHRGRDMGIFNLTNTAPSLVVPWLALALVPRFGFGMLFLVLAACALCSALLLTRLATSD